MAAMKSTAQHPVTGRVGGHSFADCFHPANRHVAEIGAFGGTIRRIVPEEIHLAPGADLTLRHPQQHLVSTRYRNIDRDRFDSIIRMKQQTSPLRGHSTSHLSGERHFGRNRVAEGSSQ